MLDWDAAAMMPAGGGAARGDQLAVLAGLAHALLTAPEVGDDLAEAEASAARATSGTPPTSRLMRHAHTRATALPARPGRGAGARQLGLREGLARGAAAVRLRAWSRRIWSRWCR